MQPRQLTMAQFQKLNCSDEATTPAFLFRLKNNPKELLASMVKEARRIIKAYEDAHPVQDKVTRKCLIQFETAIELIDPKEPERKSEAIGGRYKTACISLFSCFKTMLDICGNNETPLRSAINSFFGYFNANSDFFAKEVIDSHHTTIDESELNNLEKANYQQALKEFELALEKYNPKNAEEHKDFFLEASELKKLKDNSIDLHFCSLVLNTATQRLEEPTNESLRTRLLHLSVAINRKEPSTIMKYLPTILNIVGAIVALVGLALLTPPSLIATTLGVAAQTPTASTALSIAAGGAATLFISTRLPSPSRYDDAATTINLFNLNRALPQDFKQ